MPENTSEKTAETAPRIFADRYEILRPIGRGGMSKVFLVRDLETGEKLALKMLRSQYEHNGTIVERFNREIKAVRQLDHPCIVKIRDAETYKGRTYYTMEYIKGKSLRQWRIERGRLRFSAVVRVLCMVAHALHHAHKVTIHRDISPENIMVLPDGQVRVLDFGLAKLEDQGQALTIAGMNLGKLRYNAPEQQNDAANADHRADIFPLGVMFYELLTGKMPDNKHHLTDLRPDLPKECDDFVEKAMAYKPEDRFQTAHEFDQALRELYDLYEARKQRLKEGRRDAPKPAPESWYARLGIGRIWTGLGKWWERRAAGKSTPSEDKPQ